MKKIYVSTSKIEGRRIFAGENIAKNERIRAISGAVVRKHPTNRKESSLIENWFGIGKDLWIRPSSPFIYLNHSCDPNSVVIGRRMLIARRSIRKGEEITMDYSLTDADPHWRMKCRCGSRNCRRTILPIQRLPVRTYKKYLPQVASYFRSVYRKTHPRVKDT